MPAVRRPPRVRRRTYLREWRKYREMTLEAVAKQMGWDYSALQRLETGQTPYNQDHLEILASIYLCEPEDLITRAPGQRETPDDLDRLLYRASAEERAQAVAVLKALTKPKLQK